MKLLLSLVVIAIVLAPALSFSHLGRPVWLQHEPTAFGLGKCISRTQKFGLHQLMAKDQSRPNYDFANEDQNANRIELTPHLSEKLQSMRSVIVSEDKMIVPGEKRVVHMYDKNNLKVLKKATGADGILALVMLDLEAAKQRTFALSPVGCQVRVLSVEKTTKVAKDVKGWEGGESSSRLVELIGLNRVKVARDAVQREPFVVAKVAAFDSPKGQAEQNSTPCELEDKIVSNFDGLISLGSGVGLPQDALDWNASLRQRVDQMEQHGGTYGSRLMRVALAATAVLEPTEKVHALRLEDDQALAQYVSDTLGQRLAKTAAIKALKSLGSGNL